MSRDRTQEADVPGTPQTTDGSVSWSWPVGRYWYVLLIAAVAVLAVGTWARLFVRDPTAARFTPRASVRLTEPAAAPPSAAAMRPAEKPPLRIAVAPVISPEKSVVLYRQLVDYLAAKLDRTPVFIQAERYEETNRRVRDGQCDLAFVCTYAYVLGERDFGMQALVAPQIGGAVTYHSVILVPAGSPARGLLDLRGKRFGSADRLSNTGWLYPATWLREQGCDPAAFFAEHVITGSHDLSVRAVVGGFVDGAAVDSLVYDQMVREEPVLARQAVVVHKSPPFGMPPLVVPAHCDPELRDRLRELLVQMDGDARGREILRTLGIDRFVVPDPTLYDSVRAAVAQLEASP